MNINSSGSSYTNKASSTNGFSGLASGIDTDAMVEAMLSGMQNKIDKQSNLRQQTLWKQEILRDVIGQINNFQRKYTSVASGLRDYNVYNTMKAISSANAIKVSAKSGATAGRTEVKVNSLATSTKMQSQVPLSGKLTGEFDASALDKKVVFDVGSDRVEVDLNGARTNEDIKNALSSALSSKGVTVSSDASGKLTFASPDGTDVRVSSKSTAMGLASIGITAGSKATMSYSGDSKGKLVLTGTANAAAKATVDITLDGVTKKVTLDPADLENSLQKGIDQFGKGNITMTKDLSGKFSLTTSAGRKVSIDGDAAGLEALGVKSGESNVLTSNSKLKDLNLGIPLQGDRFSFSINGKNISVSGDSTLGTLINSINASGAGVIASYNQNTDSFSLSAGETGKGYEVNIAQTEGNLMSALMGVQSGGKVGSNLLTTGSIAGTGGLPAGSYSKGNFAFKVNGQSYAIALPERFELDDKGNVKLDADKKPIPKPYTAQEVTKFIDDRLETGFGYTEDGRRAITIDSSGNFIVNNGAKVEFSKEEDKKDNLAFQFGFAKADKATNNVATASTTLAELGLTGLGGLSGDKTLADLGSDFSFSGGRLTFQGADNSVLGGHSEKLFNTSNVTLNSNAGLTLAATTAGTNAEIEINGVVTERNNNRFEYEGLDISIETAKVGDTAVIEVERDSSVLYDTIKGFVNDYNELIDKLNTLTGEKQEYKKYPPLTDAQKKEMSENEIKLWEEKAKTGLLYRDSTISGLTQDMRNLLYTRPQGSLLALYDIGIETGEAKDKGKLVIKDDAKLKNLVESNPETLMALFRGDGTSKSGLIGQFNSLLDQAAKTTGTKGSLVEMAGSKDSGSDLENALTRKITAYDQRIKDLKYTYELQKTRYWKQFNKMEQVISQMGSQSNWLGQSFA